MRQDVNVAHARPVAIGRVQIRFHENARVGAEQIDASESRRGLVHQLANLRFLRNVDAHRDAADLLGDLRGAIAIDIRKHDGPCALGFESSGQSLADAVRGAGDHHYFVSNIHPRLS